MTLKIFKCYVKSAHYVVNSVRYASTCDHVAKIKFAYEKRKSMCYVEINARFELNRRFDAKGVGLQHLNISVVYASR